MRKVCAWVLAACLGPLGCDATELPDLEPGAVKRAVFDTPWGRHELPYEERDGLAIYQGDIVLGRLDKLGEQQRAFFRSARSFRWPGGVVPFENLLVDASGKDDPRVTAAITHWQLNTNLRFVRSNTAPDRIRFMTHPNPGVGGDSPAGRQGGVQDVRLNPASDSTLHELGHAVGFHHEQARPDRDAHVKVQRWCAKTGQEIWFDTMGGDYMTVGPYDIASIMQYTSSAFLDPNKKNPDGTPCTATILKADGSQINGALGLSTADRAATRAIYGEMPAVKVGSPASHTVADSNGTLSAASPDGRTVFRFDGTTNWSNIGTPGGTGRILALRAGGSQLFGVNLESRDIFRYNGGQSWVKVGDAGVTFAVDSVGALYGVSADSRNVTRWSGSGTTWANLTSPNGQPVSNIFAGGSNLFATAASSGDIYKWQGGTSWTKVGGPGASFAVLIDGTLFGLTPDRTQVWRWSGSAMNWTQIGGPAVMLFGGGTKLLASNTNKELWQFDGTNWHHGNVGPWISPPAVGGNRIFALDEATLDLYRLM